MKGIHTQASSAMMLRPGNPRRGEEGGVVPAEMRASVAAGPKRNSMSDLPIIQLTATGLSMKGSRKATRKNLRARMSAFSSSASPKAIAY